VIALAAEVGVATFDAYDTGDNIYVNGATRLRYSDTGPLGTAPPDPLLLADITALTLQIDHLAAHISPTEPWTAAKAAEYDGQTLETWVRAHAINAEGILGLLSPFLEALLGAEPRDASFLAILAYVAAAGDADNVGTLERLFNVRDGAQQSRLVGGSQEIAIRVAAELGSRVRLNQAVRTIQQDRSGVTVTATGLSVRAQRVIVALPPVMAARIDYEPLLPSARDQYTQRAGMGALMKVEAIYPTPFWRADGLTGQFLTVGGPVGYAFDNSPPDGSVGVLAGFVGGDQLRTYGSLPLAGRRDAVLAQYAAIFKDDRFLTPRSYFDHDWTREQWSRGGPTAVYPPGLLLEYGPAIRNPVRRIHWAGTETSDFWQGYMDGAVRSGERVATEVGALL
jgi:monoamine oxidase